VALSVPRQSLDLLGSVRDDDTPGQIDAIMRGAFPNTEPYGNSQIEAEPLP
jgi:hypothetical protein